LVTLRYFKGLLVLDVYAPGAKWSEELKAYITYAYKYAEVKKYFRSEGVEIEDYVFDYTPPFPSIVDEIKLRDYQTEALKSWILRGKRGVIVLPTGAGKTIVALKAIASLRESTLVVVPTIDLMHQWANSIREILKADVGEIGGGVDKVSGITVITYDSAYTRAEELGNKFFFVIFDEVHHLPSEGYSLMAKMYAAPHRMGLTATPEREDGKHIMYPDLVGPIVYRKGVEDFAGKYIASFDIKKVYVKMTEEEERKYKELRSKLKKFLEKRKLTLRSLDDFNRLVRLASKDKEAREALLAWHESLKIAVNSKAKVDKLKELLKEFKDEKIIIFTRDTQLAYDLSKLFLIPVVTYKTNKDERKEILEKFRKGVYRVIVASTVFDEGVDVPDANIGIVLGGYGTKRQYLQRLGRLLRGKDKNALLIEIITKGTADYKLSKRRSYIS
jgi:superfamily II DNA or RNA helicase